MYSSDSLLSRPCLECAHDSRPGCPLRSYLPVPGPIFAAYLKAHPEIKNKRRLSLGAWFLIAVALIYLVREECVLVLGLLGLQGWC
jgi:hypothetical protein